MSKADDVWEIARFIWENTDKITDRELIKQLEETHKDYAPKSTGSISKRRSKEAWTKNVLIKTTNSGQNQEARESRSKKNRKQNAQESKLASTKTNKAQSMEASTDLEAKTAKIEQLTQSLVVSREAKAALILKTRKRLVNIGGLTDSLIDMIVELMVSAFDQGADPEEMQKALVLSDALSKSAEKLAGVIKVVAEIELPLSGIGPDDFSESEQDRRLGALDKLKGIDEEQRRLRDEKRPLLTQRLAEMRQMESQVDFSADLSELTDDVEEIDFTAIDDD